MMAKKASMMAKMLLLLFLAAECPGFALCAANAHGLPESEAGHAPVSRKTGATGSRAIIVAGGGRSSDTYANGLWEATRTCADYACRSLLFQDYAAEDIFYLTPETKLPRHADGSPTLENVSRAINIWAKKSTLNPSDDLLIYLTGHGGEGTFRLNEREILRAEELDRWLDDLQKDLSGRLIVIYDACQSGTFLPLLTPPPGKKRIVITSTSDEPAQFMAMGRRAGGLSFSFQFWAHVYYGNGLADAFFFAKDMMEKYQTALMDADGNGVGNEYQDKKLARRILIGKKCPSPPDAPLLPSGKSRSFSQKRNAASLAGLRPPPPSSE